MESKSKSVRKILLFILIVSMHLCVVSCTEYKEEAPFFDGLFLEYDYGRLKLIYNISGLEDGNFRILKIDTFYKTDRGKTEMLVNKYGKVYQTSGRKKNKDKFSPIWIPAHALEIGDEFDDRNYVDRKDVWEHWEVLVIKDLPTGAEDYYEINTGYWVGGLAKTLVGMGRIILDDTNADIPTIK